MPPAAPSRSLSPQTAPDTPARPAPLFRQEVILGRQAQWLGTVLLAPRPSNWLFTAFALITLAAVAALLCFGNYTRKARVNGWLVPNLGLIRVIAPKPGIVAQIFVKEGDEVAAGAPLLALSTELETAAVGATTQRVVAQLYGQRQSLDVQQAQERDVFARQEAEARDRLTAITAERNDLQEQISIQQSRVNLAVKTVTQVRALRTQQLVTEQRLLTAEQDTLEQGVKLKSYQRNLATLDQEFAKLRSELDSLPMRERVQREHTRRDIATVEQQLAEAESRRQIVLTAPQAGTVGTIQAGLGDNVGTTAPLVTVLPLGSQLQAQLFAPSRAIGFIRPGQRVLLRYDPFPYQKFGLYEGRVAEVSRTALSPSELPHQVTGLTSLFGANEPVYRITVELGKQTATTYGKPVPLQAGMQLEADVLMENRSLLEWIFDPLYTLTGRQAQ